MFQDFILCTMAILIVKHNLLDFGLLQPPWMYRNKGTYGHPGGIAHALAHAAGSLPPFLTFMYFVPWYPVGHWCGMNAAGLLGSLFLFELFVHYHMDWFKMWWNERQGWSEYVKQTTIFSVYPDPTLASRSYKPHLAIYSNNFFTLLGIDQLVHYLTYVVMVWAWVG